MLSFVGNILNTRTKQIGFAVSLVIVVVGCYYLKSYIDKTLNKPKNDYSENVDDPNNSANKSAIVYFFYTTWCPHSLSAIPEWEKIVDKFSTNSVNGYNINFIGLDCTEETVETTNLMNKFNIEGFPTIKMVKDDQIIEFDAKTNESNIEKFLYSVL